MCLFACKDNYILANFKIFCHLFVRFIKNALLCTMQKLLLCLVLLFGSFFLTRAEDIQKIIATYRPDMSKGLIYISKSEMTLTLYDANGQVVVAYPMACGKNKGHKQKTGDMRTPEGKFSLQQIQDASKWTHDFKDGKGVIKGAYGPCFMRLKTGFSGIGIHGTHDPKSIGTRATEGCIRLENKNAEALSKKVTLGMTVIIGSENGVASMKEKTTASSASSAVTSAKPVVTPARTEIKKVYTQPAWCWPPLDSQVKE